MYENCQSNIQTFSLIFSPYPSFYKDSMHALFNCMHLRFFLQNIIIDCHACMPMYNQWNIALLGFTVRLS